MKVLLLDKNHPLLTQGLEKLGLAVDTAYTKTKAEILEQISDYDGIVIRSRIPIDQEFLDHAKQLKFIARVGAGMENIDTQLAQSKGIALINAPEGNRDALAEHCMTLLLGLMNRLKIADNEVRAGIWKREENRGHELMSKTVALIGYGFMGKAFAQRLQGFGCQVICHDILPQVGNEHATQVTIEEVFETANVVSLHVPLTKDTKYMANDAFFEKFRNPIYFLNTARGKNVSTEALVKALDSGKVIGAGLDVLEYEKSSFESLSQNELLAAFLALTQRDNVLLTPHIGGWTHESKEKLAQVIVDKIQAYLNHNF